MLAVACGASVANLYYAQPLLDPIRRTFGVGQGVAATVVTATQLGYALALALVLPLGDLLDNRKLASRTLVGTGVALLVAAFAPTFAVFVAMSVVVGLTSVVAQILIPFASRLAPPEQRGQFVGRVMSGLLIGIVLARTVASFAASALGWRSIFVISAVLMVGVAVALARVLPTHPPEHTSTYRDLLASTVRILLEERVLRHRAACQALMFSAFTSFWTAISYELINRHGFTQSDVGIFALVGAAGAIAAPIAGRLGDQGHGYAGRGLAMVLAIVAMATAGLGVHSVVLLALAGILVDLAVQSHQVLTQREIYEIRQGARARINTVYMTTVFIGGAISSAVTGLLYDVDGWGAVMTFATALPTVAALIWAYDHWTEGSTQAG